MTVVLTALSPDTLSTSDAFEMFPRVKAYCELLFEMPAFKAALDYSDEVIIAGFERAREEAVA